jgi:nucleotide-binding universal stress UspA family protein
LIRQVLCALDVLRPSRAALRHAFEIAERFNAQLDILYARPTSASGLSGLRTQNNPAPTPHERLQKIIAAAVTPIAGRASLHVVADHPVPAIVTHATSTKADLIVLGSSPDEVSSEPGARVADRVAAGTRSAVMTSNELEWAEPPGVARILMPVGLEPFKVSRVTEWAAMLGWHFEARVELLHVLSPGTEPEGGTTHDITPERRRKQVEARLLEWKEHLNGRGVSISRITIMDGPAALRIVEHAEVTRADLIVMPAPANTNGKPRAALGTLSEVRHHARTRVLSVRLEDD